MKCTGTNINGKYLIFTYIFNLKVKLIYLTHVYWVRLIIIIAFHRIKTIGTYEGHIKDVQNYIFTL